MTTYYKAVRPDGTSFHDPSFSWSLAVGGITTHPSFSRKADGAEGYLSVATVPTDCTGMRWPCRLLLVEPAHCRIWTPDETKLPNKRAGRAFRTVAELPAHDVFGPQGIQVAALIERCRTLTASEARQLAAARVAARDAAWGAAWVAAWDATRDAAQAAARVAAWDAAWDAARVAAWYAAWGAAWDAAWGLVVRDLVSAEQYDTLTGPWRRVIGPLHPDDKEMT